jgi:hypothetical protein
MRTAEHSTAQRIRVPRYRGTEGNEITDQLVKKGPNIHSQDLWYPGKSCQAGYYE